MTTEYSVDSYHFNVRQGDGAIHLLSEKAPAATKAKIVGASLIDAGTGNSGEGSDNIESMEYFIHEGYKKHYEGTVDEPHYIQFDSIVITHWDADHFAGIVSLIQRDIQARWDKHYAAIPNTPYPPAIKITGEEKAFAKDYIGLKLKPGDPDLTDEQLWIGAIQTMRTIPAFLRDYRIGFIRNPTVGDPRKTAIYAPDYSKLKRLDPAKPFLTDQLGDTDGFILTLKSDPTDTTFDSKKPDGTVPTVLGFTRTCAFEAGPTGKSLNIRCSFGFQVPTKFPKTGKPKTTKKGPNLHYWYNGICDLYYTPADMIGRDILTNQLPPIAYAGMTDRWKLIEEHQKAFGSKNPFPVGIYCLGVHRSAIGNANDISKQTIPPEVLKLTSTVGSALTSDEVISPSDTDIGSFGHGGFTVFMVDEENEPKNLQSIVTVVLWKETKEVSHYFAGDADYIKELFALAWLLKEPDPAPKPPPVKFQLPNMKLSHHGSSTSTPVPLVTRCSPENVILSAGENATYQHPSTDPHCLDHHGLFCESICLTS